MTFEDIKKANESISTTAIKGKQYAEVNQRIKAFRMLYPEGTIATELLSDKDGVCMFKASVFADSSLNTLLGTGHAYEKESSSFINKTSYIENCETSAVGRALAMCGIGIDASIASAEEVGNAIANQTDSKEVKPNLNSKTEAEGRSRILAYVNSKNEPEKASSFICKKYGVESLAQLTQAQVNDVIIFFSKKGEKI